MEKRKLQKTGGSSLSITLPKRWTENQGLKEQDFVVCHADEDGPLVIQSPETLKKKNHRSLAIDDLTNDEILREIVSTYVTGAEEVKVNARQISKNQRIAVRAAIHRLIGFEIIEETSEKIILKNISAPNKFSFEQGRERIFAITKSMLEDAVTSFIAGDKELAQDTIERDYEVDKIYFLTLRQSMSMFQYKIQERSENATIEKAHYYENIATQVERIADHATKIAEITSSGSLINKKFNHALKKVTVKIFACLNKAAKFTGDENRKSAHEIINILSSVEKNTNSLYNELSKEKSTKRAIVIDSIDRVGGYLRNIAEIVIDTPLS
jgi:phosphate uptake regulator